MEEKIYQQIEKMLSSRKTNVRLEAVEMLREYSTEKAVKLLIKALSDPNEEVRLLAANILLERGLEVVDDLIEALAHPKWMVRRMASTILAALGDDVVDDLINALSHDNDDVRYWAAHALSGIGGDKAREAIIKAAEENRIPKQWLPRILIAFPDDERVGKLLFDMLSDNRWVNRREAAQALERVAQLNESVLEMLKKGVDSPNDDVCYWSLQVLGVIGRTRSDIVDFLARKLEVCDDDIRREFIVDAIAKTGRKEAAQVLIKLLERVDLASTQRKAVDALIEMGQDIVDVLLKELESADETKRYWIYRVLYGLHYDSIEIYKRALKDPSWKVRSIAVMAIGDLAKSEDDVKEILKLAEDPDSEVRKSVLIALRNYKDKEWAREVIEKLANDSDEACRVYARSLL